MYFVYNMGVGFCVITSPEAADRVVAIARSGGYEAWRLGHCTSDAERTVALRPKRLIGKDGRFTSV